MLRRKLFVTVSYFVMASTAASAQSVPLCAKNDNGQLDDVSMRTVVVTNTNETKPVFDNRFSFRETVQHILGTASGAVPGSDKWEFATSESEQVTFLTDLVRSFHQLERSNNGVRNDASLRPNEGAVQATDLLTDMKPVGLFNRLDLAPANWRYCGEHRIVYAMGSGTDRMFIIFEAAVDNPDPTNAAAGCLGIARFWASLKDKKPDEMGPLLHAFYYKGDLGENGRVSSVLDSKHFGVPFGQIRGNLFMTKGDSSVNPWILREWRTFPDVHSGTKLVPDTVKSNPNPEFYNDLPIPDGHGRDQSFADLRPEFQLRFVIGNLRELIEVDLEAAAEGRRPTGDELFNKLSANFEDRFNDFESVSQVVSGTFDDRLVTSKKLNDKIVSELKKYKLPEEWPLTPDHILARAEVLSCAGCHNLSNDVITGRKSMIGPGDSSMIWPAALAFTHINENAQLSPALLNNFLPARCESLEDFIKKTPRIASQSLAMETKDLQFEIRSTTAKIETTTDDNAVTDIIPKLAEQIAKLRSEDAEGPGAFRQFRRTH